MGGPQPGHRTPRQEVPDLSPCARARTPEEELRPATVQPEMSTPGTRHCPTRQPASVPGRPPYHGTPPGWRGAPPASTSAAVVGEEGGVADAMELQVSDEQPPAVTIYVPRDPGLRPRRHHAVAPGPRTSWSACGSARSYACAGTAPADPGLQGQHAVPPVLLDEPALPRRHAVPWAQRARPPEHPPGPHRQTCAHRARHVGASSTGPLSPQNASPMTIMFCPRRCRSDRPTSIVFRRWCADTARMECCTRCPPEPNHRPPGHRARYAELQRGKRRD